MAFPVPSNRALDLTTIHSAADRATLLNRGDTLYYSSQPNVSSSVHDGELADNESVVLTAPTWVISAGRSLASLFDMNNSVSRAELEAVEREGSTAGGTTVNLLEFAETKHGSGSVDDTEVFTKAIAKVKELGSGTLVVSPYRKNGELATWTVGSVESGKATSVHLCSNLIVSAYGAKFKALSTGTHSLFGTDFNQAPTNELTATNVRWFGGEFVGTGAEAFNQFAIAAYRTQDVWVRDVKATNWGTTNGSGVFNFADPQRLRIENNTMTGCCKTGGFNAINVQMSSNGTNEMPETEISITGNVVTSCAAAPICVQIGKENDYVNTAPTRAIITGNDVESTGFIGIIVEMGGGSGAEAAVGTMSEILISNNIARYSGANSGAKYGIAVVNDSTPVRESGTLFTDINIVNNKVDSTRNGIQCHASYALIEGNNVSAANVGIFCAPSSTAVTVSHVQVRGGFVKMADTGGQGITFQRVTDGLIDTDISYETGASGSGVGALVEKCSRVDVISKASLAAKYGIQISASGSIYVKPGARIYNPSTNATVAAIRVEGVLTGNVWIEGAHARDDRGEAKMKYGIDNASTEGGNVYSRNNAFIGWTSKAWNGTIFEQLDDVVDTTATNWRAQKREQWGTAAPTEGTFAVGDKVWNTTPSEGSPTAFWLCTKAGTPGTWAAK
jgi:hypothetical protein